MVAPASLLDIEIPEIPFVPQDDYVVLMDAPRELTDGGLALPDGSDADIPKMIVVAVGPGRTCELHPEKRMPMRAQPGDIVHVGSIGGVHYIPMTFNRQRFKMYSNDAIVGHWRPVGKKLVSPAEASAPATSEGSVLDAPAEQS